jgi:D-alanyl-D-alanine carboxypeptidase
MARAALVALAVAAMATLTACDPPPFEAHSRTVTAAELGASWHTGCPVGPSQLRAVSLSYWGFDDAVHTGTLVVNATQVDNVIAAFHSLYDAKFSIARMEPVSVYGGSDDASMAANNTSAFNCRAVTGGTAWSEHSFGWAVDVNPVQNPYVKGSTVLPPAGAAYLDRSTPARGKILAGDATVRAFAARGWGWGGSWATLKDYQHFSATGR